MCFIYKSVAVDCLKHSFNKNKINLNAYLTENVSRRPEKIEAIRFPIYPQSPEVVQLFRP